MKIFEDRSRFILDSFSKDKTWEQRYKRIIQWGSRLEVLEHSHQKDHFLVQGCQSKVWLLAELNNHLIIFKGSSDALITKGLLALMLYFYSKSRPQDVLKTPPVFIEKLDLMNHLTPSRSNGLKALTVQIQNYAKAFYMLEKSSSSKSSIEYKH